jgi:hypothetical protein
MKNKIALILSLIFGIGAFFFAFNLYRKVVNENNFQEKIKSQEDLIKKKLTIYGQLQKLYLQQLPDSAKFYASEWQELKDFVQNGSIYEVRNKEIGAKTKLGADTLIFVPDTLRKVSVMDSIWNKSGFEIRTFEYAPDEDDPRKFTLQSGFRNGSPIFEIKDPNPINPSRKIGELDTLRIGSMQEVKTDGNWQ